MHLNIRAKIILISVISLLVVSSAITIVSAYIFRNEYQNALESKTIVVGNTIKLQIDNLLAFDIPLNQLVGFDQQLHSSLNSNDELSAISVISSNGELLFSSGEKHNHNYSSVLSQLKNNSQQTIKIEDDQGEVHHDIYMPLNSKDGKFIGSLHLTLPQEVINEKVFALILQMTIISTTSIIIVSLFLIILLNQSVAKPLHYLVSIINEIRNKGDLSKKINLSSRDELSELAAAFNDLTTKLHQSYSTLETKVQTRTQELTNATNKLESQQTALMNILEDTRQLEAAVKEERDKMNLIISSMGEGLLVVDKDYKISLINPTAEKLLKTSEAEAVGKVWTEIVTAYEGVNVIPFEKRTSIQVINKATTIHTELDNDHYYKVKSGRKFPVVSVTTPIIRDNKTIGAVKVFRDASTEKETNIIIQQAVKLRTREIEEQKAQISAILQNAGEGIVITNDEGKINYVNPAFMQQIGLSEEDLRNKDFASTIKAFNLKQEPISATEISDTAAVTAKNYESKIMLQNQITKEFIAVVINASPIKLDNQFRGVVRIVHDFTQDFQLQRQRDDFFSIASHELRTPLTVISGNLDTILQGYGESKLTDMDKQMLEDSLSSADRLTKLVEDFLNVSRLDQGRLKFTIQKVNHCKVVDSVINELKPLTQEKNLSLTSTCHAKDQAILADEGLFKEILINLIGNSIKFTARGGIMLESSVKGNKLEITVSDTGNGIDPQMHDKLFQRFQQAMKRTLSREAGGTGLGLYISREFARQMNGDLVLVKSKLGEGTTFALTLPLAT